MLAKSFWCLMALPGQNGDGSSYYAPPVPQRSGWRRQVKLLLPVTSAHSLPSRQQHRPRLTYGLVDSLHAQVLHQHLPRAGLAWGSGLQRAERTHHG